MLTAAERSLLRDAEVSFDSIYGSKDSNSSVVELDFVQWTSSFTMEQIPFDTMRAWLEDTVDCCFDVGRQKVLDVGCGTGLFLFEWLRRCRSVDLGLETTLEYTATDLSPQCVAMLGARVQKFAPRASVRVGCCDALEASCLQTTPVDVVVLNSVVGYFPSMQYWSRVVERLLPLLAPQGVLFCGDVRDSRLLRLFYASIGVFREAVAGRSFSLDTSSKIAFFDQAVAADSHLLQAPMDYVILSAQLNWTAGVLIQPKFSHLSYREVLLRKAADTGTILELCSVLDSEMNRFRFDVLFVNSHCTLRVSIPVASDGNLLCDVVKCAWQDKLCAGHCTALANLFKRCTRELQGGASFRLIEYPHVPVLVDALIAEGHIDPEVAEQCVATAWRAAKYLLTPRELQLWFAGMFPKCHLCVTLHPKDPTLLLLVVSTDAVSVGYQLVADAVGRVESSGLFGSSQPRANGKHAHFCHVPDLMDRWYFRMANRMNSPLSTSPLAPTIGSMVDRSFAVMRLRGWQRQVCVRQPDTCGGVRELTWQQFAHRVYALAEVLQARGVVGGDAVVQFVERSAELVIGMLAIFLLGAVYVPLAASPNPDPPRRMAKIVEDCCARVILTSQKFATHVEEAQSLTPSQTSILVVHDAEAMTTLYGEDVVFPCYPSAVDAVAYCIYTSGTTSTPKAVMLSHRNFYNLACALHRGCAYHDLPSLTAKDMRMLQTTAASFDLHVYECLAPLLVPYFADNDDVVSALEPQLILTPPGEVDLDAYVDTIGRFGATHVVLTPTLLSLVGEHCDAHGTWDCLKSVRVWRTGGEALKQSTADSVLPKLVQNNDTVQMWCSYGPAECTDTATMFRVAAGDVIPGESLVPIGLPLQNYVAFVVAEVNPTSGDSDAVERRFARPGEVGMLYLGGQSVFLGYLNRPELTSASVLFVRSPYLGQGAERLYRTGDLVKLNPCCGANRHIGMNFTFVGRETFAQVKLRGQRIETTEIESVLISHHHVSHVIVAKVADPNTGAEFLAAYFSLTDPAVDVLVASAELQQLATQSFPSFMVPSRFIYVERFPRNRNGKVDRNQLPVPLLLPSVSAASLPQKDEIFEPTPPDIPTRNWLRRRLLGLWLEVCPCAELEEQLSSDPHFNVVNNTVLCSSWVELGGSSTTLMRFASKLQRFLKDWCEGRMDEVPVVSFESVNASLRSITTFRELYRLRCINALANEICSVVGLANDSSQPSEPAANVRFLLDRAVVELPPASLSEVVKRGVFWARWSAIVAASKILRSCRRALAPPFTRSVFQRPASARMFHSCCMQQSLLFHDEKCRIFRGNGFERSAYNCPYMFRLSPSRPAFLSFARARSICASVEAAVKEVVSRHRSLCVAPQWEGDHAVQVELPHEEIEWRLRFAQHVVFSDAEGEEKAVDDFFRFSPTRADSELDAAVRRAANERMSTSGPLLRFHCFVELPSSSRAHGTTFAALRNERVLSAHFMLNFHHAIFDGESAGLLFHEIVAALQHANDPPGAAFRSSTVPVDNYFLYCDWVNTARFWTSNRRSVEYWVKHMDGWKPENVTSYMPMTATTVNGVWPAGAPFTYATSKHRTLLTPEICVALQAFCRRHDVTPYVLMLTCFYITLWRCRNVHSASTATVDVCVGSAMSNRADHHIDVSSVLSLVADTFPFRVQFNSKEDSFLDLLHRVRELVVSHLAHARLTLGGVFTGISVESSTREALKPTRTPIPNPFFAAVLLYETSDFVKSARHVRIAVPEGGHECVELVNIEQLDLPDFGAIFELQLKVQELLPRCTSSKSPMALTWEYSSELFNKPVVEQLAADFNGYLTKVVAENVALKKQLVLFL